MDYMNADEGYYDNCQHLTVSVWNNIVYERFCEQRRYKRERGRNYRDHDRDRKYNDLRAEIFPKLFEDSALVHAVYTRYSGGRKSSSALRTNRKKLFVYRLHNRKRFIGAFTVANIGDVLCRGVA